MKSKRRIPVLAFLLFSGIVLLQGGFCLPASSGLRILPAENSRTVERMFTFERRQRSYFVHVPGSYNGRKALPLLLAFHGGYSTAEGEERLTGFSALAGKEGFIVAYPQGIARSWSDGRDPARFRRMRLNVDDVGFVEEMVKQIGKEWRIDERRVFATGISNGAIFSFHLAAHSSILAGIAPVAGGIPKPDAGEFSSHPVSVLVINGDADPLVPYGGGQVSGDQGEIVGAEQSARMWAAFDQCPAKTAKIEMPNSSDDGCTASRVTFSPGRELAVVALIRIRGGGHTWPGGPQYLPERIIGKVCRDFSASEVIWEFFASIRR